MSYAEVRRKLAEQREQQPDPEALTPTPPAECMERLRAIRARIAEQQRDALKAELQLAEEGDAQTGTDQSEVQQ
jgi:hypothetical protein